MAFANRDIERVYRKAWYLANKEKMSAYQKARYAAKRDDIKAHVRAYAAANKQVISERNKKYRADNADKLQAKSKVYYQAHRAERIAYQTALHAAKSGVVKAYKKEWWEKNREQFSAERKRPENRARQKSVWKKWYDATYHTKHREKFIERAARRKALKTSTQVEKISYQRILKDSKGLCGICKKPLDLFGIDFDHIVPLARGGTHTKDNLQASHASCNRSKGARVG